MYVCQREVTLHWNKELYVCQSEERPVVVRVLGECYHCQRRPDLKSLKVGGQSLGLDLDLGFDFMLCFCVWILFILFCFWVEVTSSFVYGFRLSRSGVPGVQSLFLTSFPWQDMDMFWFDIRVSLFPNMDPRDPYDQRQRRARREKGGVIKRLEIPTTEDSTDSDEWLGRSLREPSRRVR